MKQRRCNAIHSSTVFSNFPPSSTHSSKQDSAPTEDEGQDRIETPGKATTAWLPAFVVLNTHSLSCDLGQPFPNPFRSELCTKFLIQWSIRANLPLHSKVTVHSKGVDWVWVKDLGWDRPLWGYIGEEGIRIIQRTWGHRLISSIKTSLRIPKVIRYCPKYNTPAAAVFISGVLISGRGHTAILECRQIPDSYCVLWSKIR